ncbi:MAG TPA: hypothetical protein VF397_15740 [Pyrinomonadaceae bacterium]
MDPFSLMLLETQHVQMLEQPMCRNLVGTLKRKKLTTFPVAQAVRSPVARVALTAILIDILIRTVASR